MRYKKKLADCLDCRGFGYFINEHGKEEDCPYCRGAGDILVPASKFPTYQPSTPAGKREVIE